MIANQPRSRREVREAIPNVQGLPYDQPTKIGRFAAWVVFFRDTFPDPYQQIKSGLNEQPVADFSTLERRLHSVLNNITGAGLPDRKDMNKFNLWAGGLTAAVHTTSVVRSAPGVNAHFNLGLDDRAASLKLWPALDQLVMEHQDRLGDIKNGLSEVNDQGFPRMGNFIIDPKLLELMGNGLIRFRENSLDQLPISEFRKITPDRPVNNGPFIPGHGEIFVGDIEPRDEHIGCPISFMGGFTKDLLTAATETAAANGLI